MRCPLTIIYAEIVHSGMTGVVMIPLWIAKVLLKASR